MKQRCKICGHLDAHPQFSASERQFGVPGEFAYFQCTSCACLQIAQVPEDMAPYYGQDYYTIATPLNERKFRGFKGMFRKLRYKASLSPYFPTFWLLHKLLPRPTLVFLNRLALPLDAKILDVGCGNAKNFLYPLRTLGYHNTVGCDPFITKPYTYQNGLTVHRATLPEMKAIEPEWDFIAFHHAFEHIPDPKETLEAVFHLLRPGGACVIRIPVASGWAWAHYGKDWVQLDAPRHLFLHTRRSIEILAQAAGLVLEKVVFDSTHFQFSGSDGYQKGILLKDQHRPNPLKLLGMKLKAAALNRKGRGDQAAFLLRKPPL